jgi:hypothetical protein
MMTDMMPRIPILRRCYYASIATLVVTSATLLAPLMALADDEQAYPDARLEGYKESPWLKEGGVGGTITFLLILIAITFGVMFINAKRSHLD